MNISEVIGQSHVKRVIEIALAGNHNILLIGPQGSGKTMWGEVVKSLFPEEEPVFIDNVLIDIERAYHYITLSSSNTTSLLIATSRLCPCGNINHPHHECRCEVYDTIQYRNQMPMWLLRAFDLIIELTIPRSDAFRLDFLGETSNLVLERIEKVFEIQKERFLEEDDIQFNSQMLLSLLKTHCSISYDTNKLLQAAIKELGLCVGDYLSILRVARTIADLAQSEDVQVEHVAEAIQHKSIDWFKG